MAHEFYVVLDGKPVEGPFPSRREAAKRASRLSTNEVGLNYSVERVRDIEDRK